MNQVCGPDSDPLAEFCAGHQLPGVCPSCPSPGVRPEPAISSGFFPRTSFQTSAQDPHLLGAVSSPLTTHYSILKNDHNDNIDFFGGGGAKLSDF